MNILNIEHISKIYGEKVIFDNVSLGIHSGDKIGVIGVTKARSSVEMESVYLIFHRILNFLRNKAFLNM